MRLRILFTHVFCCRSSIPPASIICSCNEAIVFSITTVFSFNSPISITICSISSSISACRFRSEGLGSTCFLYEMVNVFVFYSCYIPAYFNSSIRLFSSSSCVSKLLKSICSFSNDTSKRGR